MCTCLNSGSGLCAAGSSSRALFNLLAGFHPPLFGKNPLPGSFRLMPEFTPVGMHDRGPSFLMVGLSQLCLV